VGEVYGVGETMGTPMRLREALCRLDLPTRPPIGTVNVYAFTDERVTLIDTGPNCPECYEALRSQLREVGLTPADVERIVLTHGHVDHHGLAETIRRESRAEVLGHLEVLAREGVVFRDEAQGVTTVRLK